ncbi:unnamed protein product [Notodromas monacha]|uniref:C3H1-type domain-containing protein n=1 Tax=Notodromas monacha TaxID=399045 RepID=A0A7R9G9R8_9CRUS|nr:unnamed protein product [Notodromas monacha]CAG0913228.1 unnamed protein product [Notodromas monacha]
MGSDGTRRGQYSFAVLIEEERDTESLLRMHSGHGGNSKTGVVPMPCSMPASLSPTPVSRRNSGAGGPRQQSQQTIVVDTDDDFQSSRFASHRRLDRCLSEPTTSAGASSPTSRPGASPRSVVGNSSRYKTELCRAFEETGHCKYGEKCQFAHGHQELRTVHRHRKYKTELCRTYHTIGFCPYGPRCHFIHNAEEARSKPIAAAPRPLSMSSSSSTTSSPTHSDSLSGSPTSFSMFWATGDDDHLRIDSPPSTSFTHASDLDIFVAAATAAAAAVVKPTMVAPEFPEFVSVPVAPRLPVFSRLAGSDADPADRKNEHGRHMPSLLSTHSVGRAAEIFLNMHCSSPEESSQVCSGRLFILVDSVGCKVYHVLRNLEEQGV